MCVLFQVIGHVWASLPAGLQRKRTFMTGAGLYDYNLSTRLYGSPQRVYPGYHNAHQPIPTVLAYADGVLDHSTSLSQYGAAMDDIGKLAVVAGHIIGWPGAPLAAQWTHVSILDLPITVKPTVHFGHWYLVTLQHPNWWVQTHK